MNPSVNQTYVDATLAGLSGQGYLEPATTEAETEILEGCWKTEDGEEIYAKLREKYLARETMSYVGSDGTEAEVYIAGWFGVGHADCLVIRSAEEISRA